MTPTSNGQPTVIRTERGLSITGTRITLYDVLDYVTAGWPSQLIRDRLELTDQQMADSLAYIDQHRAEVEAEYQTVLQTAQDIRQYWEELNQERLVKIATQPPKPGQEAIREKLQTWKAEPEPRS
jgi:uncharacterized protein (DUF433 family)